MELYDKPFFSMELHDKHFFSMEVNPGYEIFETCIDAVRLIYNWSTVEDYTKFK